MMKLGCFECTKVKCDQPDVKKILIDIENGYIRKDSGVDTIENDFEQIKNKETPTNWENHVDLVVDLLELTNKLLIKCGFDSGDILNCARDVEFASILLNENPEMLTLDNIDYEFKHLKYNKHKILF